MKNQKCHGAYILVQRDKPDNFRLELRTLMEIKWICKRVDFQKATLYGDVGINNYHISVKDF